MSLPIVILMIIIGYEYFIFEKYALVAPKSTSKSPILLEVRPGMSLRSIIQKLYETPGVRKAPGFLFEAFVRYSHQQSRLKAGDYALEPGITPCQLMAKMVSGQSVRYAFTIIEGWTIADLLENLSLDPNLKHDYESAAKFVAKAEGLFFPDTYFFSKGTTDLKFLNKAFLTLQKQLASQWANRDPSISLKTPYEALILASIIEKETGNASERALISSVFHARLQNKMRLQADPTVMYGVGPAYKGRLTSAMLRQDTPYNTYVRTGLPPSPIALPGLASIYAALHPLPVVGSQPYLYFVAKGDGTHYFSKTLEEHNQAVNTYILKKDATKP